MTRRGSARAEIPRISDVPLAMTRENPSVTSVPSSTAEGQSCFSGNHASVRSSDAWLLSRSPRSAATPGTAGDTLQPVVRLVERTQRERARAGLPPRLLAVLVPVCTSGRAHACLGGGRPSRDEDRIRAGTLLGLAALLAASMFAGRLFRCRWRAPTRAACRLLYVFVVATTVLYGWRAGALLAAIRDVHAAAPAPPPGRPRARVTPPSSAVPAARSPGCRSSWLEHARTSAASCAGVGVAAGFVDYLGEPVLVTLVVADALADGRSPALVRTNVRGTSHSVRADGVRRPDARRALATVRVPLRPRSSGRCSQSLSTSARPTRALRCDRLALTDPLTGLGNHRHFHGRLSARWCRREERRASSQPLLFVDVDDFGGSTTATAARWRPRRSRGSPAALRQGRRGFPARRRRVRSAAARTLTRR